VRAEKPATSGPFPVVIVLHSCSGYYANMAGGSLPGWVFFLLQEGYATFKLDRLYGARPERGVREQRRDRR
jgi:dienelactone hydrolase